MSRLIATTAASFMFLLPFAQNLNGAESVRLRASVRLADDAAYVHLGDVADITGPGADALAGIRLGPAPRGGATIELPIRDIRRMMDEADVHWGRTSLSGRAVIVRSRPSLSGTGPAAMTPIQISDGGPEERAGSNRVGTERTLSATDPALKGTLAEQIMQLAAAELNVPAADLRIAIRERDAELLTRAVTDHDPEIQAEGAWRSDRVALTIRLRRMDGALDRTERLSLRPLLRTSVATPQRTLEGGESIEAQDIAVTESWLPPTQRDRIAQPDEPVGQVAGRRLRAGEPIRAPQLRAETLVQRGDHVDVRCLVGGIVITMKAEARASGAEGDVIELRKLGERTNFTATVTGTREVTLDLRD